MESSQSEILAQLGLQTLEEMLPSGFLVIEVKPKENLIYVSDIMQKMLGFESMDEIKSVTTKSFFDFLHPDDEKKVQEAMYRSENKFQVFEISFRIRKKDHTYIWVKQRSQHRILKNETEIILAFYTDITKEIEGKERERRKLNYQKELFDSLSSGIMRFKLVEGAQDAICVYANQTAIRIHGYENFPENEFNGKYYVEHIISPECRKKMVVIIYRLLNGSPQEEFEHKIIRKDGKYAWTRGTFSKIEDEKGEVLYQAVYNDVTEEKEAIEALSQSRKSLLAAVKHSDMEYWEYDIQNKIVYLDEKTREIFQIGEVIKNFPETWYKIGRIHPDDISMYKSSMDRVLQGEPYVNWECRVQEVLDGEYIWKNIRYTTIYDDNNVPVKAIATAQNIDYYKELEKRFSDTLNQNGIWTWEYDLEQHQIRNYNVNNGKDPFGYTTEIIENVPESVIANHTIQDEYVDVYRSLYERIEQGEKQVSAQIRAWSYEKKEYRWYELIFSVVEDKNGKPIKATCSSRDIETTKQVEQQYSYELEYRKEISESLISTSCLNLTQNNVEVLIHDEHPVRLNGRLGSTDYKTRQSEIMEDIQLTEEESRQLSPAYLLRKYSKGVQSISREYVAKKKHTDNYIWIHVDVKILKRPNTGDIIAFFYNRDMTSEYISKMANDAILQYDYEMAGVILSKNGHLYASSKNDDTVLPRLRSDHYDDEMARFLINYAIETDMKTLVSSMQIRTIQQQLEKEDVYTVEFDLREMDGQIRRKRMRYAYADQKQGIIAVNRIDVEEILQEEKRKQEELSKALNLAEQASIAKSDFLARISHEIRTPMNVIMGLTTLAADETANESAIKDYLEKIDISSRHLLNLINDVLDMSKIESGEFKLHPEKCTYAEMQKNLQSVIAPLCKQKKIKLEESGTLIQKPVYIDKMRISQIFINLLNNAIKFTPENGVIQIAYNNRQVGNMAMIDVSISDSGIGMTEEFQKHMFEPFTQESSKVISATQGTGLGLSIVKGTIDKMGGEIFVNSKIGEGTTFHFKLEVPLIVEENLFQLEKEDLHESGLSGKCILVVEDHPLNRMIVERLLTKKGITVLQAENGEIGLQKFEASDIGAIDMILMDIRMPVLDGLETTKEIRALNRADAKTVPIIAMTANAYDEDRRKSKEAGMNEHLSKPIEPQELFGKLTEYLM